MATRSEVLEVAVLPWRYRLAGVSWQREGSAFLLASAIALALGIDSFRDPAVGLVWACLGTSLILRRGAWGPKRAWVPLLIISASATLAVPGSILWGNGIWEQNAIYAVWIASMLLLYYAVGPGDLLAYLTPWWLAHAGLTIAQGVQEGSRVAGIAHNSAPAAGFLVVGSVYLLTTRRWYLALPLIVALPFTGSRWPAVVMGGFLLALAVSRCASVKKVLVAALLLAVLAAPLEHLTSLSERLGVTSYVQEFSGRLSSPLPRLLPTGITDGLGMLSAHNVPMRLALETGLASALAWGFLTLWLLWRRPRMTGLWWAFAALSVLSLLEWYPVHHPIWWGLLAMRLKAPLF